MFNPAWRSIGCYLGAAGFGPVWHQLGKEEESEMQSKEGKERKDIFIHGTSKLVHQAMTVFEFVKNSLPTGWYT